MLQPKNVTIAEFTETRVNRGFMRTVLNILNFVLGVRHHHGTVTGNAGQCRAYFTLPLTRSCWEITRLSLFPYGNEAIHVDELNPAGKASC